MTLRIFAQVNIKLVLKNPAIQKKKIGTHYVHVFTAMLTKCVGEGMGRTNQK